MQVDPNNPGVDNDLAGNESPIEQPVIPTVAELQGEKPPLTEPGESASGIDPEAPYGRKKDGTPAKKRGRQAGSQNDLFERLDSVTQSTPRPRPGPSNPPIAAIVTDYRAVGQMAANLWFNVPQTIFGEDWSPEPNEIPLVAKGFTDYFQAKGISQISPELSLGLILLGYTAGKLNKPTVKSRFSKVAEWIKSKIRR